MPRAQMITDASELVRRPDSARQNYDVCIVGAGPAGISLALELGGAGLSVCLLEAGGDRCTSATQRLFEGEVVGDRYPPLRDTRCGALGGTSNVWAGWCRPLESEDFGGGYGPETCDWPFSRDVLMPYYHRAHNYCGLARFEYEPAVWAGRLGGACLLDGDPTVEHTVFHVLPRRFGEAYRGCLDASENIDLVLNAPAGRLITDQGNSVEAISLYTLQGTRTRVVANRYVLAAGGIENPRLLLLSADSPDRILGNGSGLVGRYFTDHPFVNVGELIFDGAPRSLDFYFPQPAVQPSEELPQKTPVDHARVPAIRAALTLSRKTRENEGIQNCAMFFHPRHESHPVFETAEVRAFLEVWNKLRGKAVPGGLAPYIREAAGAPHRIALAAVRKLFMKHGPAAHWRVRAMFETQSQFRNRVTLSEQKDPLGRPMAKVEWRLSEHDFTSMQRAMQIFDARLRDSGVGRLNQTVPPSIDEWRRAVEGGKHHMGTTRMHTDSQYGVVDPDGRVHGTTNLYVTGSSVFPRSGYANPTLTIVALAIRLADHLSGA